MNESMSSAQWMRLLIVFPIITLFFAFMAYIVLTARAGEDGIFSGLKTEMIDQRLLVSDNCFAYKNDLSGRTYAHVIDLQKFNSKVLHDCLGGYNDPPPLLIELQYFDRFGQKTVASLSTNSWSVSAKNSNLNSEKYPVEIFDEGSGEIFIMHLEG